MVDNVDENDVRTEAARRLRVSRDKLSGRIWEALRKKGLIGDVVSADVDDEDPAEALDTLVAEYTFLSDFDRGSRGKAPFRADELTEVEPPDRRLEALAAIIAAEAEQIETVLRFRAEVLGSALLAADAVPPWIAKRAAADTAPSSGERFIYWAADHSVKRARVSPGSDLDRLHKLTRLLGTVYGWETPAAALFVLAGEVPQIPRAIVTTRCAWPYAALTRIVLEVDARTAPREVERLYSQARLKVHRGKDCMLSDKTIALAMFAAMEGGRQPTFLGFAARVDSPRDPAAGRRQRIRLGFTESTKNAMRSESWRTVRERWNRKCEADGNAAWVYDMESADKRFARDVREAWRRVTGRAWAIREDEPDYDEPT